MRLGLASLGLGYLAKAEEYVRAAIEIARSTEYRGRMAAGHRILGEILLCQGASEKAVHALETALLLAQETGVYEYEAQSNRLLARIYLRQGDRVRALSRFERAAALMGPEAPRHWRILVVPYLLTLVDVLNGLEDAYGDPEAFRAFCRRYRDQITDLNRPAGWEQTVLAQWCLEPSTSLDLPRKLFREDWIPQDSLSPAWVAGIWSALGPRKIRS